MDRRKKAIEELQRHRQEFAHDHGWSGSVLDALDAAIEALQTEQKLIYCKDCNEWHRGKNKYGDCCYSDEGFCCVHSIITGENYYCGDAERR